MYEHKVVIHQEELFQVIHVHLAEIRSRQLCDQLPVLSNRLPHRGFVKNAHLTPFQPGNQVVLVGDTLILDVAGAVFRSLTAIERQVQDMECLILVHLCGVTPDLLVLVSRPDLVLYDDRLPGGPIAYRDIDVSPLSIDTCMVVVESFNVQPAQKIGQIFPRNPG